MPLTETVKQNIQIMGPARPEPVQAFKTRFLQLVNRF
jgi:hypothetical protein